MRTFIIFKFMKKIICNTWTIFDLFTVIRPIRSRKKERSLLHRYWNLKADKPFKQF